jgi:transposase
MEAAQSEEKRVTLKSGRTRLFRSKQERRQIVEETLKPGASVSLVARTHGVNTNQVFSWRRMYRKGQLESESSSALLAVKISDAVGSPAPRREKSKAIRRGVIEIDLGHARVRIEGAADLDAIRSTLESLRR